MDTAPALPVRGMYWFCAPCLLMCTSSGAMRASRSTCGSALRAVAMACCSVVRNRSTTMLTMFSRATYAKPSRKNTRRAPTCAGGVRESRSGRGAESAHHRNGLFERNLEEGLRQRRAARRLRVQHCHEVVAQALHLFLVRLLVVELRGAHERVHRGGALRVEAVAEQVRLLRQEPALQLVGARVREPQDVVRHAVIALRGRAAAAIRGAAVGELDRMARPPGHTPDRRPSSMAASGRAQAARRERHPRSSGPAAWRPRWP